MSSPSRRLTPRRRYNMDSDLLVCDICLENYDENERVSRFLSCHHSFCQTCLAQVASDQQNIECPSCRKVTSLGTAGVQSLQSNFYISYMQETLKKLDVSPTSKGCAKHSNQPLSFFCQKCRTTICRDCTVLEHKERDGHELQDIHQADAEQRDALCGAMEDAKVTLSTMESHMIHLDAEISNLTLAKDNALADIESSFQKYMRILEVRKLQLCKEIMGTYTQKQEKIINKSAELTAHMKNMLKVMAHCEKTGKKGRLAEVVEAKSHLHATVDRVKSVISDVEVGKNFLLYNSKNGMDEFQVSVGELGGIFSEGSLPSRVQFIVKDISACVSSEIIVLVFSYNGERLSGYPLEVQVQDPYGDFLTVTPSEQAGSEYKLGITPQVSGEHRLVAMFLGKPIKGSETLITVKSNNPVVKVGGRGTGQGTFRCPRAVATDGGNFLYVADTGNRVIQKLDADGRFLEQFRIDGGNDECSTCDLALDLTRNVIVCTETYVGTTQNPTMGNTVAIYSLDGALKHRFTNKVMKCALCVATNGAGEIVVSDYVVHSLFVYNERGTFVRRIGDASMFNHPAFITVGQNNNIIVSDTNNDCVQIFDQEGNFISQFGESGSGKGQLKQPFGVATDGDYLVVVDSGNKRIQVFKEDGTFVSVIESKDEPLDQPRGLAITRDGHIYVADRDNHCIKKYKYK